MLSNISKLGLGTVEIGLPYGIEEQDLPSDREAERILKTAIEMGITYFDTARGYGVAEERIGKFGISHMDGVVVGTKCAQFLEKGEDPRGNELEEKIREEIETSLRNLRVDSLQLVQLHGGSAEQINRGELAEIMQKLIGEGKVQHIGIATRGEEAPLAAIEINLPLNAGGAAGGPGPKEFRGAPPQVGEAELTERREGTRRDRTRYERDPTPFFTTIQTAYSILDQRMAKDVLPRAQERDITVINRSVLLKGALTPAVWKLPPQFDPLKENAAKAAAIAKELHIDLPTLAFRFVISNPAITTALIGTVEPTHLRVAQRAIEAGPLPENVIKRLYQLAINDADQVDPARWP